MRNGRFLKSNQKDEQMKNLPQNEENAETSAAGESA